MTVPLILFCSCRIPWKRSENNICEREMVECSDCSKWIHRMCERMPDGVFEKKKKKNQNKIGCVISAHQKELKIHLHIHSHIIH